ncbi:MAG: hypothetical protein IT569_01185 [Leptospiraceae bacterium]|nr:hypothetical protein [Leptospiraceae bacterium]
MRKISEQLVKAHIWTFTVISVSLYGTIRPPLLFSPLEINPKKKTEVVQQKPEKEKKRKIPTSWGGSELTQEDKEQSGIKITTYNLRGGAWILHDKVKLSARAIEVIGEDAVNGFLKGGVKIEDSENKSVLYAGKGVYDKYQETVVLDERPQVISRGKDKEVTKVTAPYIKRYLAESKIALENGVILENKDYTILGEAAVMLEKEDKVIMENYPYIFGKNKFMSGQKLYYDSEKKDVILENEAMIIQTSMEKKRKKVKETKSEEDKEKPETSEKKEEINLSDKSKSKVENEFLGKETGKNISTDDKGEKEEKTEDDSPIKVTSIFSGDKIVSHSGSEMERYTGMFGNAKMIRPDNEFQASYIKAFGKDNERVEARDGVTMIDYENNVKLSGNLLEYDKPTEYTHVTDDAKIEFLNKETKEVNSTLTAVEIERFSDKKEIVARGDVSITTEDSISKGEFATYFEGEEKIYLEGNPTLTRNGKTIKCGKIIVYPNQNKVFLSEGVNVEPGKEKLNELTP